MEYAEMPHNWSERYYQCFKATAENLKIQVTDFEITRSVDILKSYNPRIPGREQEIAAEVLFTEAVAHGDTSIAVETIKLPVLRIWRAICRTDCIVKM